MNPVYLGHKVQKSLEQSVVHLGDATDDLPLVELRKGLPRRHEVGLLLGF